MGWVKRVPLLQNPGEQSFPISGTTTFPDNRWENWGVSATCPGSFQLLVSQQAHSNMGGGAAPGLACAVMNEVQAIPKVFSCGSLWQTLSLACAIRGSHSQRECILS